MAHLRRMYSVDTFRTAYQEGKLKHKQMTITDLKQQLDHNDKDYHTKIRTMKLGDLFPDIAPVLRGSQKGNSKKSNDENLANY